MVLKAEDLEVGLHYYHWAAAGNPDRNHHVEYYGSLHRVAGEQLYFKPFSEYEDGHWKPKPGSFVTPTRPESGGESLFYTDLTEMRAAISQAGFTISSQT